MAWTITRTVGDGRTRYTGLYRDPQGRTRSAGTFAREKDALRAAERLEDQVYEGKWIDPAAGRITFQHYAEDVWLPSRHLEVTTRAGYRSYLRIHFVPFFRDMQLARIMPSTVQEWVNQAGQPRVVDGKKYKGPSPRSIAKYHVMLHSVFARAVRDRVIAFNPCEATELPKIVSKPSRTPDPRGAQLTARADAGAVQGLGDDGHRDRAALGENSSRCVPGTSTSCAARSPSRRPSSRSPARTPRPGNG